MNITSLSIVLLSILTVSTGGLASAQQPADGPLFTPIEQPSSVKEFGTPATTIQNTFPPSELFSNSALVDVSEKRSKPTVNVTGFFQIDAGYYSQDEANRLTLGDINDGLGFRRARLAAKGNVTKDTSYIIEYDIAQTQARFVDVWMQLNETRLGNIRIGRFRQPFGMSELTSARNLPFLERGLTFSLRIFRQTGVMLFDTSDDERVTWAVAGYRYISDNFGNVYSDSGGYGFSSRFTRIVADWGCDRMLHVGVDYSFDTPGRGILQFVNTNELFLGQNPILGPGGLTPLPLVGVPLYVNSGPIAADSSNTFNLESALAWGRFAFQSEARLSSVNRTGGGTASFPGAYAQVRYMLTGETIPYSKKNAVFGRIVPHSPFTRTEGAGAWEILGRVSHIDLNDSGNNGRRLTNFTVGCNWYLNEYTKFQFNWIHSSLDDETYGGSISDAFAVRAQLDF